MDHPEVLSVSLRERLEDLRSLYDAVDRYCEARGLPRQPVGQLQLALEEHITNILRHGGEQRLDRRITVQVRVQGDEIVAEVGDQGPAFNPLSIPPPDVHKPIDERPLGGLGIHMMRQLTDRQEYRRKDSMNILTLYKKIPSATP